MATKKILVSDNSGSSQEISTASIGYNDTTNQLSASKITAYNLSSSLSTGVLLANGNTVSSSVISATGTSGSLLQYSGSAYTLNLPTAIGGDLSGSTTVLGNVKVISVANVNSGTLPFGNGGTGLSSVVSGVLIKGTGDTLQTLNTLDAGSVIGLNSNGWFIDTTDPTTNYAGRVDLIDTSMTWIKKGNPRFLKVTIVGGGGGGGGAYKGPLGAIYGGRGGAGGGATQVILEASNIASASINIGLGGATGSGGPASNGHGTAGGFGGATYFSCSAGSFYATGGSAGSGSSPGPIASASSGQGNLPIQTQDGATAAGGSAPSGPGGNGIYTSGGGGGAGIAPSVPITKESSPSGYLMFLGYGRVATGSAPNGNGQAGISNYGGFFSYYYNGNTSLTSSETTPILGTGGGGGGRNNTAPTVPGGDGGNAGRGSGGGGGGSMTAVTAPSTGRGGNGGSGGKGFVIIESY